MQRLNAASLLVIDDLGVERSTDYTLEKVYDLVDTRYRANKPLILTTNLSVKEMQQNNDIRFGRIYDRIFEVCYPIELRGKSWRYGIAARRYDEMEKMMDQNA